ncbi:NADH:flavin oxidoreductase/NADH oxidase [Martelella limonii]|uniref:NADH:flavin oxidoreductase/NADH oxidase n=1 Tax=Martelella limonii TaxID=1647649 RepID=UPI00313FF635
MTSPMLFTPFTLGNVTFPNRVVVSPMCQYEAVDGYVQDWHRAHHARFALGGVGGAVVEATGVTAEGRITPSCLGIWDDSQIDGLATITALYRKYGIPTGIQLGHSGRKGSSASPWDGAGPLDPSSPEAWQTVAPGAVPHSEGWPAPHALEADEIGEIVDAFAAAAKRAVAAGFDFVEIHGAHGYLIHTFISPLSNTRTDSYGGSFENRIRLALEVTEAVRAAIPADMPLFYRASAVDHAEGGLDIGDTVRLAKALKEKRVDLIDCSAGGINGPVARTRIPQTPGHQIPYADEIRRDADIATMAVGLITDAAQAEAVIAEGKADLVALGRELLSDPAFGYHAAVQLGLADPESVLPKNYGFYLSRRREALARHGKS